MKVDLYGVYRQLAGGKTIELESESGLPDGQEVSVTVEATRTSSTTSPGKSETDAQRRFSEAVAQVENLKPGEGLRRSFGAWAEDAEELDKYLENSRQRRKLGRRGIGA